MQLQVLGCGDAFGSGGRFHTCFHVSAHSANFLVDCGASSLIALRRFGVDPNTIQTVLISHLHGDHFGGLPFLPLDAQFVSKRRAPLTIAGPPTLTARLHALRETMFPGSTDADPGFQLDIVELESQVTAHMNGVSVTPYPVRHPSGAPSYALRCQIEHQLSAIPETLNGSRRSLTPHEARMCSLRSAIPSTGRCPFIRIG
jgi:ribonuclease BN (tRNA processing enzyme)